MIRQHQIRLLYPLAGTLVSVVFLVLYWANEFHRWISLSLTLLGLLIWWSATMTLGKSFSLAPQAHSLVQNGLYSKIRHPIYCGISITSLGWALLTYSPVMIVLAVVVILSSLVRASLEEKKLIQKFGQKYSSYREKTWF